MERNGFYYDKATNQWIQKVVIEDKGSNMELYGKTIDDRPAAADVPIGAAFMIVGTDRVWQSDGTDWVVVS